MSFFGERQDHGFSRLVELCSRAVCVLGLRSDSFARAAEKSVLADALRHPVLLTGLSFQEFSEVIEAPARALGVSVDEDLVDLLRSDLGASAEDRIPVDSLPLLSNSLLMTWSAGSGNRMSVAHYLQTGGIARAVELLAERVMEELGPDSDQAAKSLFLRLVRVTELDVVRAELVFDSVEDEAVPVMSAFVDARILTLSDGVVRISHDALLNRWPRLRGWIEESRNDLLALSQLKRATELWEETGRDSAALVPVSRMGVLASSDEDEGRLAQLLTSSEADYLSASDEYFLDALKTERQVSTRLRALGRWAFILAALSLILAFIAGGLFVRASRFQLEAQSRQVALEAGVARQGDPYLEGQLALVAGDLFATREAASALINATSSSRVVRWRGASAGVLAGSRDGAVVIRADRRGVVTVWDSDQLGSSAGRSVELDPMGGSLTSASVACVGGRTLIAVGGDNVLGVWDVTDEPRLIQSFWRQGSTPVAVDLASDGKRVAVGTREGRLLVFDVSAVAKDGPQLDAGIGGVTAVAFSPGGTHLWVAGSAGEIRSWSWQDGWKPAMTLPFVSPSAAICLHVSPDGLSVAAGLSGRKVAIWNLSGSLEPRYLAGFLSGINQVSFSGTGAELLVASADQSTHVFDVASGELVRHLSGPAAVTGVVDVGGRVVNLSADGSVRVWLAEDRVSMDARVEISHLAADEKREWVVAATNMDGVSLWRFEDSGFREMPAPIFPAGVSPGASVTVSRDGRLLFAGGSGGEIVVWRLSKAGAGAPQLVVADAGVVADRIVSVGNRLAVLGRSADKVLLFRDDAGTFRQVKGVGSASPQAIAVTDDGKFLVVATRNRTLEVWNVEDDPKLVETVDGLDAIPVAVSVSRDNVSLAVGFDSGTVRVFNIADPVHPVTKRVLLGSTSEISSVYFAPGGDRVVASSNDGHVWLWDPAEGYLVASFNPGIGRINDLLFTKSAELLAGGSHGVIREFSLDLDAAKRTLCAAKGDGLSGAEWQRHLPGVSERFPCD